MHKRPSIQYGWFLKRINPKNFFQMVLYRTEGGSSCVTAQRTTYWFRMRPLVLRVQAKFKECSLLPHYLLMTATTRMPWLLQMMKERDIPMRSTCKEHALCGLSVYIGKWWSCPVESAPCCGCIRCVYRGVSCKLLTDWLCGVSGSIWTGITLWQLHVELLVCVC